MAIIFPGAGGATRQSMVSGAQVIDGSLKFDSASSNYLNRTPSSASNRKTWTWSGWVKKTGVGTQSFIFSCMPSGSYFQSYFSGDKLYLQANNPTFYVETTRVFRDLGWYHIVIMLDTPRTDPTDRLKLYVNGEEASFGTDQRSSLTQNIDLRVNDTQSHSIGAQQPLQGVYANFNLSQVTFIDGQALGPSYFGFTDPLTNTWRPKRLREGDQAVKNKQLLYNVNTSDNGFDSSSTSRTYDAASRTFSTYTTPQSANQGGVGANAAHVYKSPTGSAITWVVSTDTTDRYIWTSENGVNWTSKGSYYDTDSSPQSVTSVYIALAAGSNSSNVTVTSTNLAFGTNGFYLPMDNQDDFEKDKSGKGNNWTKQGL